MELPLFLSLRRKYGRLFHWSLKKHVTAASLNTSSYICLIRNLFPRIYCFSLLLISLTTLSHVVVVVLFFVFFVFFFYLIHVNVVTLAPFLFV